MTFASPNAPADQSVEAVFGRRYVRAFTEGDCWHLALELRRLTGLPLAFLNPFDNDTEYWEHVGLVLPGGHILDVQGTHTQHDWAAAWSHDATTGHTPLVVVATTDDHVRALVDDMDRQFPWSRVRAIAQHLVTTHIAQGAVAA